MANYAVDSATPFLQEGSMDCLRIGMNCSYACINNEATLLPLDILPKVMGTDKIYVRPIQRLLFSVMSGDQ